MAIPEPSGELWSAVRAISDPWPPDSEDTARSLAESWRHGGRAAADTGTAVSAAGNDLAGSWADSAGGIATDALAQLGRRSTELNSRMTGVSAAAENYANVLTQTKTGITSTIAANEGSYQSLGNPAFGAVGAMLQQVFAARVAAELEAMVQAQAASLPPVQAGPGDNTETDSGVPPQPAMPPVNATPQQIRQWWDSLTPEQQHELLHDHPEWLGNLDGLPARVRDQANRDRLPRERAALQQKAHDLRAQLDSMSPEERKSARGKQLTDELANTTAKLDSLQAIYDTLNRGGDGQNGHPPPRMLLTLDTSGLRVKAAVGVGNVDTAPNVATFVPGLTTTVNDSLETYDTDMAKLVARSKKMTGGDVAAIAWLGYDAPQLDETADKQQSVLLDNAAHTGADKLNGFLNGLEAGRAAGSPPMHLTVLGHSYGSLTAGLALQRPNPVDDVVVFGSPGLDINNVHDLQVPDGHVYAAQAVGDPVTDVGATHNFGASPYGMPGIQPISTAHGTMPDGEETIGSLGHSQYLEDGTTSQHSMAAVVAGRPDLVQPSNPLSEALKPAGGVPWIIPGLFPPQDTRWFR